MSDIKPPKRPTNVPPEAVWAGGTDGGAWIWCKPHSSSSDQFSCKVYHDQSGERIASGDYVLKKSGWNPEKNKADLNPVQHPPSKLEFTGFDGDTIYLKDALVLIKRKGAQ